MTTTATTPSKSPRKRYIFPTSLTDLNRFRKTVHGHDGSSRIVMVRKTDQRTFASLKKGEQPKLETITRETIETFRGPKTEYKVTTEKRDEQKSTEDLIISIVSRKKKPQKIVTPRKKKPAMDFEHECLRAHNQYREKHGVDPLHLNPDICKASQFWADELMKRNTLEHSPGRKYGENIYCIKSTNANHVIAGNEPVDLWYKEGELFMFGFEPYDMASGHFTQVVWKSSTDLGIGIAKNKGRIIVVCNYYPAGNVVGEFAENVLPIGGESGTTKLDKKLSDLSVGPSKEPESVALENKRKDLKKVKVPVNGVDGDFKNDFLLAHNEYRHRHGVPNLILDDELCKYAQEWAEVLASKNVLEHRKRSPYGENIYSMYSSDPKFKITGHTPVDTWYEEKKDHVFGKEPTSLKTGHFTQVVWKSSKKLGVGWAKSRQGYIYVVANYHPAGNFVGEYVKNVPDVVGVAKPVSPEVTNGTEQVKTLPADTPETSDTSGEHTQFQQDALKVHNEYRKKHGVPPLKLDADPRQAQKTFVLSCLEAHNKYREKHKVTPLKLDMQLVKAAQTFADDLAASGLEKDFLRVNYGENLCYVNTSDPNYTLGGGECVDRWYKESKNYEFGIEPPNPEQRSHFTQMVWKSSTEFGAGISKSDKRIVVVCLYMPPGNILGYFAENVPPVGGFVQKKAAVSEDVDLSFTYVEDNFKANLIKEANKYRKRHGAAPLTLDEEISKDSQELAEKMAEKNVFEHRIRSPYGTLMFGGRSADPLFKATGKSAVDTWYRDSKGYDFTREPPNLDAGNFTQLVWKRSKKIGIGYAKNKKSGSIYIVADFSPPGNYKNDFVKNVSDVVDVRIRQALKRGEAVVESETELQYVPSVSSLDKYKSDGVFTPFQLYCLDVHNEYRKLHGVPPLKLNKEICDFAKEWAKENLRVNKMFHRPDNKYGENIYTMYSSDTSRDPSARVAVKAWYDEIVDYNFDNEDIDFTTLHFTQVIWRDSKEMGVDWVKNDKGNAFVVANYTPRGNVRNRFRQNVPRPLKGPYSK